MAEPDRDLTADVDEREPAASERRLPPGTRLCGRRGASAADLEKLVQFAEFLRRHPNAPS
ncbi:MAG: hypothetical protein K0R87_1846 [Pseudonocardia sp.]|jgi:hypothetical protein|nr:hypothetical protein [Pseudonocardia sp.]